MKLWPTLLVFNVFHQILLSFIKFSVYHLKVYEEKYWFHLLALTVGQRAITTEICETLVYGFQSILYLYTFGLEDKTFHRKTEIFLFVYFNLDNFISLQ